MSPTTIAATIVAYFAVVVIISAFTGKSDDNAGFFNGGRRQKWYFVAFAMIGSAMSGVTFVSVPGMVAGSGFSYMQMTLGFIAGQAVIAFVLVPLFYRKNLISIYGYLQDRLGVRSWKTGAWFFFISKLLGAGVRLYLLCISLQVMLFSPMGLPFWANAAITVSILFIYTFRGGIKSVIGIDSLKTLFMLSAIGVCTWCICKAMGIGLTELPQYIAGSGISKVFYFSDPASPLYFFKQFFGGMFILIAMTGLDQDMMQRNLSCRNAADSSKNIMVSSLLQTVVILAFLVLGVLLYGYAGATGAGGDATGDKLFPVVATSGSLPVAAGILFILGLVSSSFAAGGSALTALTTSFTVDILGKETAREQKLKKTRHIVHACMATALGAIVIVFGLLSGTSAIDAVYRIASYTYGPILGMFAFGILTNRRAPDFAVPAIAIAAPLICLVLQSNSERWFGGYTFGYEILVLNAGITFTAMLSLSRKIQTPDDSKLDI